MAAINDGESLNLTRGGETLVVVKTFLKHYKAKGKYALGDEGQVATDDIFFDERVWISLTCCIQLP